MIKFYSYLRIILISIIVILSVLTTIYCFGLENSVTIERSDNEEITEWCAIDAEIFTTDIEAVK